MSFTQFIPRNETSSSFVPSLHLHHQTVLISPPKFPLFNPGCSGLNPPLCWFYTRREEFLRQVPLQNEASISVINISIEDHLFCLNAPQAGSVSGGSVSCFMHRKLSGYRHCHEKTPKRTASKETDLPLIEIQGCAHTLTAPSV